MILFSYTVAVKQHLFKSLKVSVYIFMMKLCGVILPVVLKSAYVQ